MDITGLKEKLKRVNDPRRRYGNLRHKSEDIFVIGLATLLCEGEDFEDTGSGIAKVFGITPWDTGREHVFPGIYAGKSERIANMPL